MRSVVLIKISMLRFISEVIEKDLEQHSGCISTHPTLSPERKHHSQLYFNSNPSFRVTYIMMKVSRIMPIRSLAILIIDSALRQIVAILPHLCNRAIFLFDLDHQRYEAHV